MICSYKKNVQCLKWAPRQPETLRKVFTILIALENLTSLFTFKSPGNVCKCFYKHQKIRSWRKRIPVGYLWMSPNCKMNRSDFFKKVWERTIDLNIPDISQTNLFYGTGQSRISQFRHHSNAHAHVTMETRLKRHIWKIRSNSERLKYIEFTII